MERQCFEMFQQHSSVPMHNRLRNSGGSGGVENPERMFKRNRFEIDSWRGARCFEPIGPLLRRNRQFRQIEFPVRSDQNDPLEGRQLMNDLADCFSTIKIFASVVITGGGQQQFRLDLSKSLNYTITRSLGWRIGPNRADTGASQASDDGLGPIREKASDAIAFPHAGATESIGCSG